MNEKEVAEIRRRYKPEKNSIPNIRGCYVNEKGEIVSEFNQSLSFIPESEAEKFLSILKRTLSGTLGKNLLDIEFSTQQVAQSPEHGLLMALRSSSLKDEDAVHALFERIIHSVALEDNYVILLAQDTYDIPYRSKDGETLEDASTEVFSYILCSVCPVKLTKPALSYYVRENEFHSREADWIVSPPELGFMFPAFDDRSANIYNALYYTRDIADIHDPFIDAIFHCEPPMPATAQKENFQAVLETTLADECNFDMVQAIQGQLKDMILVHKESKEEEPLTVSKNGMRQILQSNGVEREQIAVFDEQFDQSFGAEAELSPRNIVDTKQIEVTTADVIIRVAADRSDLIETQIINGTKYILVRVEDGAELNGVPIHIV